MNAALHRISAQANAVIGTLSPIATIVLATAILGERMTGIEWLGHKGVLAHEQDMIRSVNAVGMRVKKEPALLRV